MILRAPVSAEQIVAAERGSIREFVARQRLYFVGSVLDFGCGKSPYRDLIPGVYEGYDQTNFPGNVSGEDVGGFPLNRTWDTILCTQVLQYVDDPLGLLANLRDAVRVGGHLVLTYPSAWREIEGDDKWRFTFHGIRRLLSRAGWPTPIVHETRARVQFPGAFEFSLGGGLVARKT